MSQGRAEHCRERRILLRYADLSDWIEAAIYIALPSCFGWFLRAVHRAVKRKSSLSHFDGWKAVILCTHLHNVTEMLPEAVFLSGSLSVLVSTQDV